MSAILSAKQQRFIDEYLVDMNGSAAAVRAGYGPAGARVAAHRLLTNANVAGVIQARQHLDAHRLEIGRLEVIQGLLDAVSMARECGDAGAMVAGYREIGRMLGFYPTNATKVAVRIAQPANLTPFEHLTDAELQRLAS